MLGDCLLALLRWQIPNAGPANIFDLTLSAIRAMPRFSGELVAIDVVGTTCKLAWA